MKTKSKKKLSKKEEKRMLKLLSDQWDFYPKNFYPEKKKKYRFRGWSDIFD